MLRAIDYSLSLNSQRLMGVQSEPAGAPLFPTVSHTHPAVKPGIRNHILQAHHL